MKNSPSTQNKKTRFWLFLIMFAAAAAISFSAYFYFAKEKKDVRSKNVYAHQEPPPSIKKALGEIEKGEMEAPKKEERKSRKNAPAGTGPATETEEKFLEKIAKVEVPEIYPVQIDVEKREIPNTKGCVSKVSYSRLCKRCHGTYAENPIKGSKPIVLYSAEDLVEAIKKCPSKESRELNECDRKFLAAQIKGL